MKAVTFEDLTEGLLCHGDHKPWVVTELVDGAPRSRTLWLREYQCHVYARLTETCHTVLQLSDDGHGNIVGHDLRSGVARQVLSVESIKVTGRVNGQAV